jgi:hypothetical protein
VGVLTGYENGENRDPQESNSTQERPAYENNDKSDAESFQSILNLTGFILFKNQTKNGMIRCLILEIFQHLAHHSALNVKKIVTNPETGEAEELIQNIGKVCADAWNELDAESRKQWSDKALDFQVGKVCSHQGTSYLWKCFVKELKYIALVRFLYSLFIRKQRRITLLFLE